MTYDSELAAASGELGIAVIAPKLSRRQAALIARGQHRVVAVPATGQPTEWAVPAGS